MFDGFYKIMTSVSEAAYKEKIIQKFVPATGMQEKLEEGGIHVLDVGCGRGMHIAELGIVRLLLGAAALNENHLSNVF